jgi:hypothetical protein
MPVNFDIKCTMGDEVGKYYFGRSDPGGRCRCGLNFDPVREKTSESRHDRVKERKRREGTGDIEPRLAELYRPRPN